MLRNVPAGDGEKEAWLISSGIFNLEDGERIAGEMPPRQSKKIKEFILANKEELMEVWDDLSP